ncbi:MAG: hypothetical protein M9932_04040 [Xanthobacteraceae bacterium]|nr:hypothetical protein [Xanthobacteraceae bacterium]
MSLGVIASVAWPARARDVVDIRKLPMRFAWVPCQDLCRGWISATGVITADTPKAFEDFASDRDLTGATIVLDSSGGSVNDTIALGRVWRGLGLRTTVGATIDGPGSAAGTAAVIPDAACESMCVFLLLSGKVRYVPPGARVRVHQIWMGDRANDARAASYTAQDLMIVQRDIGRLAKYTFDMGGSGDLLGLALSIPPWEALRQLSPAELWRTHIATTDAVADVLPARTIEPETPIASATAKPIQDRLVNGVAGAAAAPSPAKATKTADAAAAPVGGPAPPGPAQLR